MNAAMEAATFFHPHLPEALRRALDYAGTDGFVASLPQLLQARVGAPFNNDIWDAWFFTSHSEESTVATPQGNPVALIAHGGGIFSTPARFRKLYLASVNRLSADGFTGLFGAKILPREARDLLQGRLPDGGEIPVFSFSELKRGIPNLPRRHAVVMDFAMAKESLCGFAAFDALKDDPLMIVRAGGVEAAAAYLDKAAARCGTSKMGCWHPFRHIDPSQPQCRVPNLAGNKGSLGSEEDDGHLHGYDADYGIGGDSNIHNTSMINIARYVAVAPFDAATSLRHLPFAG